MNNQKRKDRQTDVNLQTLIIDTALSLAGEVGWANVTLQKIGRETDLPEQEVKAIFPSEWNILEAFRTRTDLQIADRQTPNWSEGAPKERLFEVLMERIDVIEPWKPGLASVASYGIKQPIQGFKLCVGLNKSMATMLDYAQIRRGTARVPWQAHGLTAIYLLVLRRWFSDDSDDLGPTMAELNEKLIEADRFLARVCGSTK
ncbi:MAG: hypothetical protein CMM32_06655 [Rhodospirillaceae bacterium]|nr:hypothetical protein [Rhodospirillaceae bacterium]|tara:strand:- start:72 stop:677 length:606 start_codon:yes stop_codon:yes gene_type:complete